MSKKSLPTKKQRNLFSLIRKVNQQQTCALVDDVDSTAATIVSLMADAIPTFEATAIGRKFMLRINPESYANARTLSGGRLTACEVKMEMARVLVEYRTQHLRTWLAAHNRIADRHNVTGQRLLQAELMLELDNAATSSLVWLGYAG